MKALIRQNTKFNTFEGARLRKTIKGALEMVGVEHTSNTLDNFDVIHLIAPVEDKILDLAEEYKIPIIVSALYTEDDPSASYLEEDIKDGKKTVVLKPKALKFLNRADLVLVPVEENIEFLQKNGVKTPIKQCSIGVNIARFNFSRDDEKEIFYRYFREDDKKKIVVALGEYDSEMNGISAFLNAARKCPDAVFYYIGRAKHSTRIKYLINKKIKNITKNVHFVYDMPDDVYRSAILNASIFMLPGYKTAGVVSIYEAMAGKCQIIARKSALFKDLLSAGETAHIGEFSETLSSITKDYLENKIKPTIDKAYDEVSHHTLLDFGNTLIEIYKDVISKGRKRI